MTAKSRREHPAFRPHTDPRNVVREAQEHYELVIRGLHRVIAVPPPARDGLAHHELMPWLLRLVEVDEDEGARLNLVESRRPHPQELEAPHATASAKHQQ